MPGFAESLAQLDRIILMEIYPARELPIPGITSEALLQMIAHSDKRLANRSEVLSLINSSDEVILTIGAGDIDQLVPLIEQKLKGGGGL